jgi:hypothetical protein
VLKYGSSFPIRIQGKTFKPRRLGRGRRKLLTGGEESGSALPPSAMRIRCGNVYICVPDTPIDGPQPCPKSVKTCPAGFKRVLKKGWEGRGGPSKRFQKVGKRSRKLLSEDEALPLYVMKERCGPIYECVPDIPIDGPQPCPKSVKTCPAGMKKVLKPGFGAVHSFPIRGGLAGYKGGKRRRRKVLANEDESALPPSAMRQRCGPIYICVPDTKGPQPCPKSVKTCPAGMKKVLKPGFGDVHIIPKRAGFARYIGVSCITRK